MTVVLDGEAPRGAAVGVFEIQIDFLLDVATGARGAAAAAAGAPAGGFLFTRSAAEERMEEIGEGIGLAEHFAHFFFGHRAVAAAARRLTAEVGAPAAGSGATGRRTGLLVLSPVGAELVVFLALGCVAEHFIGLVELLEAPLGRLVFGLTSGWCLRASFRNACLISFSVAVFATPSVE